ncbi:MAG TPA: D-alanyl-D-alanine carboxypeptidase family protein [Chloroflexota bacterium]|nr:D-alanyl-D-alanine carboxypeptidase family protein [Chloroflexota bacterium]
MRRSEAVLLFLFIATAAIFLATRPRGTTPPTPLDAAATAAAGPSATAQALVTTSTKIAGTPVPPPPTPTPAPPYLSQTWLQSHPPADVPAISAQGVIVLDRDSQQIMYAKDIDTRRPPASIMKLVTAMVSLDLAKPSQSLVVSASAANMEPNRMGLTAGETITVQDLLYGLLLDSGNDAAEELAEGLGGAGAGPSANGRDAFLQKMNEKAAGLGLKNTHFVDPAGLDDDNYTTPYDMAVLANQALAGYPTIRTVVSTKEIAIPGNANHKWFRPVNLNDLLWDYPGTYGMKVGYTDAAGYTIVLAGQKNNRNVMIVLLGSKAHFTEGRKLFDWAYAHLPVPDNTPVSHFATNLEHA